MIRCQQCQETIDNKHDQFTLKIELFPAVEPSLEITAEDLEGDIEAEYEQLIEMMNQMSDKDIARQEKLTYLSHTATLCPACRHKTAKLLEKIKIQLLHPGHNPDTARRN